MTKRTRRAWLTLGCVLVLGAAVACGDDEYQPCEEASDCDVPDGRNAVCLPKADEGFCSWTCSTDPDCAGGELKMVCSPFESNPQSYCFPSCDGGAACPEGLSCRSTGGGNENRRICFPEA